MNVDGIEPQDSPACATGLRKNRGWAQNAENPMETLKNTPRALAVTIWVALICLAAISLFVVFGRTLGDPTALQWNSWAYAEWLINYEAGFVRRGLIGQWLHSCCYTRELFAVNLLVFLQTGLLFFLLMSYAFVVLKDPFAALLFLLAPTGMVWMAVSNEYYFRKEVLSLCAVLIVGIQYSLWSVRKNNFRRLSIYFVIFSSSLVVPFVHEGHLFFTASVFYLVLCAVVRHERERAPARGGGRERWLPAVYLVLSVLMFALFAAAKGNKEIADGIWKSLSPEARNVLRSDTAAGGITSIGWTLFEGVKLPISATLSGTGSYYIFPSLLSFFLLGFVHMLSTGAHLRSLISRGAWMQFGFATLALLPLFALGWDWGRWVLGLSISFLVLRMANLDPPLGVQMYLERAARLASKPVVFLLLLLLLSGVTRIPECCIGGSGSNYVGFLSFLKKWLNIAT